MFAAHGAVRPLGTSDTQINDTQINDTQINDTQINDTRIFVRGEGGWHGGPGTVPARKVRSASQSKNGGIGRSVRPPSGASRNGTGRAAADSGAT